MSDSPASSSAIPPELRALAKSIWWLVLARGILAVVFGILALTLPTVALLALVFLFVAYAIVDGIANVVHAVRVRARDRRWGWLLAQGVVSVLAGLVALVFPLPAGITLGIFALVLIGIYAIMMGVAGFPAAASIVDGGRKVLGFVIAVLSVVAGVVLLIVAFVSPVAGVINLIWLIGVYAILFGILLIVAAVQARRAVANTASRASAA